MTEELEEFVETLIAELKGCERLYTDKVSGIDVLTAVRVAIERAKKIVDMRDLARKP